MTFALVSLVCEELVVELFVLAPIGLTHLGLKGRKVNGRFSLKNVIAYTEKLSVTQYLKWSLIGILACALIYIPLYPAGLYLRENVFYWLPQWYFNPGFGTTDINLIANVFLIGIFVQIIWEDKPITHPL